MNLTKLFNFKYLLQNLKKSKMALILFFMIVPLFTSLTIIASGGETLEFIDLGFINILGLYVIPFIFSFCLFGYVFKKTSVDFIGSMPISRKCIFITNTIGGIVLIFLLQLVTFLLTILLGAITDCTIFVSMALDIFIFQTVAYIFVFTIANLAMSLSGNVLTQIVLTLLIAFLVPFTHFFVLLHNNSADYEIVGNGYENVFAYKSLNYTAPSLVANRGDYEFNEISMYKMIGLSIIYFAIGLIAFNKRKMEIAGESFENKIVHFVVKGLTIIPFVVILVETGLTSNLGVTMIILAIITIYYFLYDLITNKKMKFRDNVIGLVSSVVAVYGALMLFISIDNGINKQINLDSIREVRIEDADNLFSFETKDDKEIEELLRSMHFEYSYVYSEDRTVEVELIKFDGTSYSMRGYIKNDKVDELMNDMVNKMNISKNAKFILGSIYDGIELSNQKEKELRDELNRILNGITYKELKALDSINNDNIVVYEYKNHKLKVVEYPIDISEKAFKIVTGEYNNNTYKCVEYENNPNIYSILFYGDVTVPAVLQDNSAGIRYVGREELCEFMRQNYKDEVSNTKGYAHITGADINFFTNNTEGLIELLRKIYIEKREEISEYYGSDVPDYYDTEIESAVETEAEMVE